MAFIGRFTVQVDNLKAVRGLSVAVEFLEEMAETFPDRPDVRRALKAARYAARHLVVREAPPDGGGGGAG